VVAGILATLAVTLVLVGSADAPIDVRGSAFWYRTLRSVPGLVDVCGHFTWLARMIPPAMALAAGVVLVARPPRTRLMWGLAGGAVLLAAVLGYATTQNAVPWGEIHCILD
jgi:hypothetical protein